jgi:hypothetical protein
MTPIPLLLFVWGLAMILGILPYRVLFIPVPKTPDWHRVRRILGCAAILSSGLWLILDWTLPLVMDSRQSAGERADAIGIGAVVLTGAVTLWILSRQPAAPSR